MVFSKSALLLLSLFAFSVTASPLSSAHAFTKRQSVTGPERYSCGCVSGSGKNEVKKEFPSSFCHVFGGSPDGDENKPTKTCKGLTTQFTNSDCNEFVNNTKAKCKKTS